MKAKDKIKAAQPKIEAGAYMAVCVGVYGIGEQEHQYKNQKNPSYEEQIVFSFEIPSETYEQDGETKPTILSTWGMKFSNSANAQLRKFTKGWRGKDFASDDEFREFEWFDLLGNSAMVNVEVTESGYNNIVSVMPLPKGMPDPSPSTPLRTFDVDEWDDHTPFDELPPWVQRKIENSTQYKKAHLPDGEVDFPDGSQDGDTEEPEETPTDAPAPNRKRGPAF